MARRKDAGLASYFKSLQRGLLDPDVINNLKAWGHGGGFSIHTEVRVPAYDKAGSQLRRRTRRTPAHPSAQGAARLAGV